MPAQALGRALGGLALLALAAFGPGSASAGSFSVNPVRVTLTGGQTVGALTVLNNGDEPTVVQLEVVNWSQRDGNDVYWQTKEILATPPIFTVPPGGSQIVRVGLRRPPDAQRELAYRLFLQEVPPPPKPGFQGLQVALRLSIPVFVVPTALVKPALQWQAFRAGAGDIKVRATNTGTAHVQLANFTLSASGGAGLGTQQAAAYLLPGQSRDWTIKKDAAAGSALHVVAQTDGGDMQSDMVSTLR